MTFNVSSVSLQWNGKLCEGNYKAAVDLISYFRPQICRRWVTSVEGAIRLLAFSYPIGSTCNTYWRPTFHRKFLFQKVVFQKFLSCNIQLTQHATHVETNFSQRVFVSERLCRQKDVKWPRLWLLLGKGGKDKRFSYLLESCILERTGIGLDGDCHGRQASLG